MVQYHLSFGDAGLGIVARLEPNSRTNLEFTPRYRSSPTLGARGGKLMRKDLYLAPMNVVTGKIFPSTLLSPSNSPQRANVVPGVPLRSVSESSLTVGLLPNYSPAVLPKSRGSIGSVN